MPGYEHVLINEFKTHKMMNKILLIITTLIIHINAISQPLTIKQVEHAAMNFYKYTYKNTDIGISKIEPRNINGTNI